MANAFSAPRTCIHPSGRFIYGIHRPSYRVKNLRENRTDLVLGHDPGGDPINNSLNFPDGDIIIKNAGQVYEVPNPFPFWGATYILKDAADLMAEDPLKYRVKPHEPGPEEETGNPATDSLPHLPRPIRLAFAQTSRDPEILKALARLACRLEYDQGGRAIGIRFEKGLDGRMRPAILDHDLFEVLGNNPALPYDHKLAMVLNPGAQGTSPVVGEFLSGSRTHVWEYLRANSYVPWGHYASNMAQDSERYSASVLSMEDVTGLRHLYYQRVCVQMALSMDMKDIIPSPGAPALKGPELEEIRKKVNDMVFRRVRRGMPLPFSATMWGWNYGFDFSPSGYRLHASHQQIHHQFALIPPEVTAHGAETIPTYVIGDQVAQFCSDYCKAHGTPFFQAYLRAIKSNTRMDDRHDLPQSLIVHEDSGVLITVPKAQRSQGEVQIILDKPVGNVLEADTSIRTAIDRSIFMIIRAFHQMGAEMVTCCEVSKRFGIEDTDQRLFYYFLPRHPQSPGAFSERQQRWITGHFPEDFAEAFRKSLPRVQSP